MHTSRAVTLLIVALFAVLCAGLLAELLFVVPGYEKTFADFRLVVPTVTAVVIGVSRWMVKYWYVVVIFGLFVVLPIVALVTWRLRHRSDDRLIAALWCAALLLLPALAGATIWLACFLPWRDLMDGLKG